MSHTNHIALTLHPDRSRGVFYLHALAWLIFILVPIISAWTAITSMGMQEWLIQFGIMTLRSMAVFYMMYFVLIPQLLACGGAIRFLLGSALSITAIAASTTIIDAVFFSVTGLVATPINPELQFLKTTGVWMVIFASLTLIALAGRITFDWFTISRSWYKGDFDVEQRRERNIDETLKVSESITETTAKAPSSDIWVRSSGSDIKLAIDDIYLVESMKDYLIYSGTFGKVMVYQRLKDAESELAASGFVRIHRSYLINTAKIDRKNAATVTLGDIDIPIGPTYRDRLV